jgi:hypothetical protein
MVVIPAGAQTIQSTPAPAPAAQARVVTPPTANPAATPPNSGSAPQAQGADQASRLAEAKSLRAQKRRESLWLRFWAYTLVIIGGAHGGLIYGISRNRGVIIPHFQDQQDKADKTTFQKLDLGWLGDVLVGIGGGIIIFNLVPQTNPDIIESLFQSSADFGKIASLLMKVLALSLIGGFAGISLFDEAAKRISQELEEVRSEANASKGLINQLNGESDLEAQIQYLLNPMTNPSVPPLTESQNLEFKQAVIKAPLYLRNKVFERLQRAHSEHLITGNDPPLSKPEIQNRMVLQHCLQTGFVSLIAAADEQEKKKLPPDLSKHRYQAHNGFIHNQIALGNEALGLQGNNSQLWRQGEEDLDEAIISRDNIPGSNEIYWYYNFQRMLCRFKLGKRNQVTDEINEKMTVRWLQQESGILYSQTKLMPTDFLEFLRATGKDKPELSDLIATLTPPATKPPPTSQAGPAGEEGTTADKLQTASLTTLQSIRLGGTL